MELLEYYISPCIAPCWEHFSKHSVGLPFEFQFQFQFSFPISHFPLSPHPLISFSLNYPSHILCCNASGDPIFQLVQHSWGGRESFMSTLSSPVQSPTRSPEKERYAVEAGETLVDEAIIAYWIYITHHSISCTRKCFPLGFSFWRFPPTLLSYLPTSETLTFKFPKPIYQSLFRMDTPHILILTLFSLPFIHDE